MNSTKPLTNEEIINSPTRLAVKHDPNYRIPNHIELINNALMDVAAKKIDRLIINMPPRHGKSELISKYFPAWFLLNHTNKRIIEATYSLAESRANIGRIREIIGNDKENELIPAEVCKTYPVRKADLLIIDDPIRGVHEAESRQHMEAIWNWYVKVSQNCIAEDGAIVLVMSRWHNSDLTGNIIKNEGLERWETIILPAIATKDDKLGRAEGETLWEDRVSLSTIRSIKSNIGDKYFNLLYQQNCN